MLTVMFIAEILDVSYWNLRSAEMFRELRKHDHLFDASAEFLMVFSCKTVSQINISGMGL